MSSDALIIHSRYVPIGIMQMMNGLILGRAALKLLTKKFQEVNINSTR